MLDYGNHFQVQSWDTNGTLKNLPSPFDRLRANGRYLEIVAIFPFILSLPKHGKILFQQPTSFFRARAFWMAKP